MAKTSFQLKDGINRLTTEVQETNESITIVGDRHFATDNAAEIAALDANDAVERVQKGDDKAATEKGGKS